MPSTTVIMGVALAINLLMGIMVYFTNSRRLQNRFLFLFCLNWTCWGVCVLTIMGSSSSVVAEISIRLATYISAIIPVTFHMLCLSITHSGNQVREIFSRAKITLIISQLLGITFFTPFFMTGVIMPEEAGAHALGHPEAQYGPGFLLMSLYFVLMPFWIFFRSAQALKRSSGIQKTELQFTLLGLITTVIIAVFLSAVLPVLTGSSQWQQFGPLGATAMILITSYGIATRRVMDLTSALRLATSYALLAACLAAVYFIVFAVLQAVGAWFKIDWRFFSHLTGTLVVAFLMAPAYGRLHQLAGLLFGQSRSMDIRGTLREAHKVLQSISTIDELFKAFSEVIMRSVRTDRIGIYIFNGNGFRERYASQDLNPNFEIPADDPMVIALRKTREPLVTDYLGRTRNPFYDSLAVKERMNELKASMAVGIYSKNNLDGIMLMGDRLSGALYGPEDQDALQLVCEPLSTAMDNAMLFTEVQNSKTYNEILLENMVSGVVALDQNGLITVFNQEAQRILNQPAEQLLHQDYTVLPAVLKQAYRQTHEGGVELRNKEVKLPDEVKELTLRMGSSVIRSHEGDQMGILLVFHDVTALKNLEMQLRRSDRLASIGTLSAGMAHEIKNPLVSIKTFTQLLPERYHDEDFRNTFSELIGVEIHRIDSIVNQVLNFARPAKPILEPTHFSQVVENTIKLLSQKLRQQNITLSVDCPKGQDLIQADAGQLEQVVVNLILNAVDSMPGGGQLFMRTQLTEADRWSGSDNQQYIRFEIQDTGDGIPEEDLSHVFDPFFTTKHSGTGLGLSVVHGIIQEHRGSINVSSAPGEGTTFTVTFPLIMEGIEA